MPPECGIKAGTIFVATIVVVTNLILQKGKLMSTFTQPQSAASASQVTTWNLDPVHSVAEFKVRHMMISNVKGQFTGLSGVLRLDEADLTNSSIEATIDAASINTRDSGRDTHLKSAD